MNGVDQKRDARRKVINHKKRSFVSEFPKYEYCGFVAFGEKHTSETDQP